MSRSRLKILIVCGVAVVLAAWMVVDRSTTPPRLDAANSAATIIGEGFGPAEVMARDRQRLTFETFDAIDLAGKDWPESIERTLTVGRYPQTETGALQAAVALLETTEDVVAMTPADARAYQQLVSTRASASRLGAEVDQQLVNVQSQTPQGLRLWLAPFAARTTPTEVGYEVAIWYAEVMLLAAEATAEQWQTVTYSMVWQDDGWKMDDSVSTPGPTPQLRLGRSSESPSAFVGLLEGYSDEALVP